MELNKLQPKAWYKSKTVWAGIITILVTTYDLLIVPGAEYYFNQPIPKIPPFVYGWLGALGVYGRIGAKQAIRHKGLK